MKNKKRRGKFYAYPKQKSNTQSGITLVALVITIVLLVIISSVTISISISQLERTKLQGFYSKLEIAQEGIEKIARTNESYKDSDGNIIYLKNIGERLTTSQENLINDLGYDSSKFKYVNSSQIEQELGIHGVDFDLLIDFDDCIVISAQGIEVKGKKYYTLENNKYRISEVGTKNEGSVDFTYEISNYGSNSYKIIIKPINVGDITEGIVKYKKNNTKYWNVAENNEIIINQLTSYDIMYTDTKNHSVTKTITLTLDSDKNIVSNEIQT